MIKRHALLAFIASAFCWTSTHALAQLAPAWVTIRSLSFNGSGCPLGTVASNISPDRQAFTLAFSDYFAEVGPGISLASTRRNCQITADLNFPSGWSFSIVSIDYRGFAYLENGVTGTHAAAYYFQGQGQTARSSRNIQGFFNGNYFMRDLLGLTAVVWSPCGATRALNINSEVRVDNRFNRRNQGFLTVDSIDGEVKHTYNLSWRRC